MTPGNRARLAPSALQRFPDIGPAIGLVVAIGNGWVGIEWGTFQTWHKAEDVEVTMTRTTNPKETR